MVSGSHKYPEWTRARSRLSPDIFTCSHLPWQINVLQAKKKFEILDSVSAGVGCTWWGPGHRGWRLGLTCVPTRPPQMLSFMHAQYSFFQQGYSLLHQLDPYMKKLAAEVSLRGGEARASVRGGGPLPSLYPSPQLDQLVIDSAVEKREMERKHAAIQQRVRPCSLGLPVEGPSALSKCGPGRLPQRHTPRPSPGLPTLRLILILLGRAVRGGSPHPSGSQHSERSLRGQDQPPQPTGARAGAGWRVLLGPLCSWPDSCHGAALGGDDCWWELLVPRRRRQGFTHWLSLSLLPLLPLPPSDTAAGEWAPTQGWGGGTGGLGPLYAPPRFSTKDTSTAPVL